MPVQRVAVVAPPHVAPFELGIAWEAFGIDRSDEGLPPYDLRLVATTAQVTTSGGWSVHTEHGLDAAADADLVVVPAFDGATHGAADTAEFAPMRQLLRDTVERGALVMSFCSGAFLLGAAGILDGHECTTHWRYTDQLARRHPQARVDRDVLFVCDGPLLTSAGTAAGLDLCLHLIRLDHGEEVARRVARRMVMPPHRDGGQAQYVDVPDPPPSRRHPGPAARRAAGRAGRHPHDRVAGDPQRDEPAHLRPPLPGRDRHDSAPVADAPAGAARPAPARDR